MTHSAKGKLEELWQELVEVTGSEVSAEFLLDRILRQVMLNSWQRNILQRIR